MTCLFRRFRLFSSHGIRGSASSLRSRKSRADELADANADSISLVDFSPRLAAGIVLSSGDRVKDYRATRDDNLVRA